MKTILLSLTLLTLAACDGSSKHSIWGTMEKSGSVWGQEDVEYCKQYNTCQSTCGMYGTCEE